MPYFYVGLDQLRINYPGKYYDNDIIRHYQLTPKKVVDELLQSHAHFILSHPHQGLGICAEFPEWSVKVLEAEFRLLEYNY